MIISEETFIEKYKPIKNHLDDSAGWDGYMFNSFGVEDAYVRKQDEDKVWSVVDDGDGSAVSSGFHTVNLLGYIITEVGTTNMIDVVDYEIVPMPDTPKGFKPLERNSGYVEAVNGGLTIDIPTGIVTDVSLNRNEGDVDLESIVRFDMVEWENNWKLGKPKVFNLLDLCYWTLEGRYVRANEDVRIRMSTIALAQLTGITREMSGILSKAKEFCFKEEIDDLLLKRKSMLDQIQAEDDHCDNMRYFLIAYSWNDGRNSGKANATAVGYKYPNQNEIAETVDREGMVISNIQEFKNKEDYESFIGNKGEENENRDV